MADYAWPLMQGAALHAWHIAPQTITFGAIRAYAWQPHTVPVFACDHCQRPRAAQVLVDPILHEPLNGVTTKVGGSRLRRSGPKKEERERQRRSVSSTSSYSEKAPRTTIAPSA